MYNQTQIKSAKYFAFLPMCKTIVLAVFSLLLMTATNINVRGQAADDFNPNVTNNGASSIAPVQIVVRQPDGKILIGGSFTSVGGQTRYQIARVNENGKLDTTFTSPFRNSDVVFTIAVQTDGKILVGGVFQNDGQPPINIQRLNNDGALDITFNNPLPNNAVRAITVLENGKILIGGTFSIFGTGSSAVTRQYIARLNGNGSLDGTFNPIENFQVTSTSGGGNAGGVHRIIQQSDGKILIAGFFRFYYSPTNFSRDGIARFNPDGTFDSFQTDFQGFLSSGIYDVKLQPNGKILIGGAFQFSDGQTVIRRRIARLNTDGTLDLSFDAMFAEVPNNLDVRAIALQADGKILVGGVFVQIGGQQRNIIARLNPDGTADNFSSETYGAVNSILLQPDGKIVVGGSFPIMGGQPRNNIARLYSSELGDGTQPILFTTNRDGNYEIYRMNVDGSNQQRLTNTLENENGGLWSPNGQKILYGKSISNTSQIWVMNADGTNQKLISETTGLNNLYKWSPNGQKIVFVRREPGGKDQIWTMNADGTNKTRLTNTTTHDHYPDWSPDGSKIAFGRCNANGICDIFTMNADGSNQVNITPNSIEDDEDAPQWSNDGSKIVFAFADIDASGVNVISSNVFIINADGTNRQSLTNGTTTSSFAYRLGNAVSPISPNDNKIALRRVNRVITTTADFQNSFEISSVGIDGSNLVNLTNNSIPDNFGAWSPDSEKIAFQSRRDATTDEIYTMNADGSGVVRLTFNSAIDTVTDWFRPSVRHPQFDFDGDGKSDFAVFRLSNGIWYLQNTASGFSAAQFGITSDKLAPADYDGDGRTDIAVFRDGIWYLLQSKDGFKQTQFGQAGDAPLPGDWDGDGKADLAVYRPGANAGAQSTFYYRGTLNNPQNNITFVPFGAGGDKPLVGDFDGDGKQDAAVFRPSNGAWYVLSSSGGTRAIQFGLANDKLVPADYDGDGKTDVAVYRNGVWYILNSSDSQVKIIQFGLADDKPTVSDYDGDGKADISVWRASNGVFYVLGTQSGFTAVQFGTNGDVPVASVYVP